MEEFNKSCDQCGTKKRKCPGGKPCSRCVHSTETCTYSKRRPRTPSSQVAAMRLRASVANSLLEQYATPSLKRYRWSASPATGLVGLQESGFLSDFFGSAGFMPLATQSGIREAMVKIMISPNPLQQQSATHGYGAEEKFDTTLSGADNCRFWCAVAIGALVKGHPIESVAAYCRLAREPIASFSGPANPEMAKAWASLAYLHGFMDEPDKFHEYLALSQDFLDTEASDSLPVGFTEIIQTGETIKIFVNEVAPEERELLLAQELARPKLGNLLGEGEICRCVFQSARIFEQAIGTGFVSPKDSAISNDPASTRCKVDIMADLLQFRKLEELAEIPSIKDGIAGLIINDHLLFENTMKGDTPGALERIGRCIDVFERYPGICRFKLGKHKAHIMIGVLVGVDIPRSHQLYARLRAAYNLTRPAGDSRIPPLEEWRGGSAFCHLMMCRSAEMCGKMAFRSSLGSPTAIGLGEDDVHAHAHGASGNERRQELIESPASWQAAAEALFTGVDGAPSAARHTISMGSETIGSSAAGGSFPGLAPQAARGHESGKEAVAAEDWLEVAHAMMGPGEVDGTLG